MADNRYNLDTLISKYIHRPIIKSDETLPPLYARVGTENESTFDLDGMKNPIWQQAVASNYNSPTNVRRLFIGDKKVSIQYFQPPISGGKSSGKYWVTYNIKPNEELDKLAFNVLNYNQVVMDAAMKGERKPDRASLSKTGMGAFSNHWKMSNIEEVYITPSILMSEDIRAQFGDAEKVFAAFMAKPVGVLLQGDLPLKIFEYANGFNIKNIRTRFPRLRTVAFATNIDKLLELRGATNLREGLPAELSDLGLRWFDHVAKLGAGQVSSFMQAQVPFETTQPCVEFSIRPGIYKFDATILQPFVDKYKAKVLELGRKQRDAARQQQMEQEKAAKSEYETYLDELLQTKGEAITKAAIQLTFARSTKEEIDSTFNEMSTDGKQKYRQMLGR